MPLSTPEANPLGETPIRGAVMETSLPPQKWARTFSFSTRSIWEMKCLLLSSIPQDILPLPRIGIQLRDIQLEGFPWCQCRQILKYYWDKRAVEWQFIQVSIHNFITSNMKIGSASSKVDNILKQKLKEKPNKQHHHKQTHFTVIVSWNSDI